MTDGNHELSNLHTKHVLPLYARIDELEAQLREAKAQTYCQICGSILSDDGRWQRVEDANTRLRAEVDKHRNRANEVRAAWEMHRDFCAQYKIREELAAAFGAEDPVEAARIVRAWRTREARLTALLVRLDEKVEQWPEPGRTAGRDLLEPIRKEMRDAD